VPGTDDLSIRYLDEDGTVRSETFEMLVLSVGLEVAPDVLEMGRTLGIDINVNKFAETSSFTPVTTRRPSRRPASTSTFLSWPISGTRVPGCT